MSIVRVVTHLDHIGDDHIVDLLSWEETSDVLPLFCRPDSGTNFESEVEELSDGVAGMSDDLDDAHVPRKPEAPVRSTSAPEFRWTAGIVGRCLQQ